MVESVTHRIGEKIFKWKRTDESAAKHEKMDERTSETRVKDNYWGSSERFSTKTELCSQTRAAFAKPPLAESLYCSNDLQLLSNVQSV